MNELKTLAARLLQNPDVVKSLASPQALAQLAGLGPGMLNDDKIKALVGLGKNLSGLLTGSAKPASSRASPPCAPRPVYAGTNSRSAKYTAIVGTVALTAVTGAVVAVGTVSAVALSKGRKARQP